MNTGSNRGNKGVESDSYGRAEELAAGLYPHQVEGVAFLLGRRRAILADEMGIGKTRQAIVALRQTAPEGPYLVICPASVKSNWEREILSVHSQARTVVVNSAADTAAASGGGWTILNYDILARHMAWLQGVDWAGLIFDEAHYIKNHKSRRSALARQLVTGSQRRAAGSLAVYALTGTPLTNRPRDLFPLLQLIDHPLGKSFLSFAKRYCAAYQTQFGWVTDGASEIEELTIQLRGAMLRRTKSEVLDLPPKIRTYLPVPVTPGTGSREVREVVEILLRNREGSPGGKRTSGGRTATRPGADRLRIIATLTKARQKLAVAKAATTIDFLTGAIEQGEKVIVFSCFDEPLKRIAEHFGEAAVLLTGATPAARRQDLVDRFQKDEQVRVFVSNIYAGGVGLNLTAARQVVFNDLDWVPANHWQAEDRAHRIGQANTVNITYMVGEKTVDDFVSQMLETKTRLVRAVIDGEVLIGEAGGDILSDLEKAISALSPRLPDLSSEDLNEEIVAQFLRDAADLFRQESLEKGEQASSTAGAPVTREALLALAQALTGAKPARFRVSSNSRPGLSYLLTADSGGDVDCSCPGFEYRGQCSHARVLKSALASGGFLPPQFTVAPEISKTQVALAG